jgi:hypothetical protein
MPCINQKSLEPDYPAVRQVIRHFCGRKHVSLLMTRIRAFQILVITSALLYIAWLLLPHAPRTFSQEIQNILALGGYGGEPWVADPRFYLTIGAENS